MFGYVYLPAENSIENFPNRCKIVGYFLVGVGFFLWMNHRSDHIGRDCFSYCTLYVLIKTNFIWAQICFQFSARGESAITPSRLNVSDFHLPIEFSSLENIEISYKKDPGEKYPKNSEIFYYRKKFSTKFFKKNRKSNFQLAYVISTMCNVYI